MNEQKTSINETIILPYPKVLEKENLYVWDANGYVQIQKIYSGYLEWIKLKENVNILIQNYEDKVSKCKIKLQLKDTVIDWANDDREWAYEIRQLEEQNWIAENRKQKIKTVLMTLGGVIIGTGAGIIIGVTIH